jgi:diaminopimelate decarboxylase
VALAREYGTPLYVYDEADLRAKCREYVEAFRSRHPSTVVAYASKAYASLALLRLVAEEGLSVDVVSGGELAMALAAGVPPARIYLHGNNKQADELEAAVEAGIRRIVLDNFHELELLQAICARRGIYQPVLLRLGPSIDPHTHLKTTTGTLDVKFGFAIATGDAERAVAQAMQAPNLDLLGYHVHLGSPIFEMEPYEQASDTIVGFAATMKEKYAAPFEEYSPGGGFALQYIRGAAAEPASTYAEVIINSLHSECERRGLPLPSVSVEPGRSLVGRAGLAVYTAGARKEIPGVRTYVSVDGGMADNARPAMYGSKYEAILPERPEEADAETITLAGKFCESGDILIRDIALPRLEAGGLVALPASGAYNLAMASNYNLSVRPAVVFVRDGRARLVRRRESYEDLMRAEIEAAQAAAPAP